MPVRCWLIMFFIAQSMARVNRNDDITHPCRTPDFTVNFGHRVSDTTGEVPLEDRDEFHQRFWNSIVPQDFQKGSPCAQCQMLFSKSTTLT